MENKISNKTILERLFTKKDESKPLSLGNINYFKTFIGNWQSFAWFVIILFIAYGYSHDTQECRKVLNNMPLICEQFCIMKVDKTAPCLPELEILGFCEHTGQSKYYNASTDPFRIVDNNSLNKIKGVINGS